MKNSSLSFVIGLLMLVIFCWPLQAKDFEELDILKGLGLAKDYYTFEDVDDIWINYKILDKEFLTEKELKEYKKPVSKEKGDKLIKRINDAKGMIYTKDKDLKKLIEENVRLDGRKIHKKTKKVKNKIVGLPFFIPAEETVDPGEEELKLTLKGGWKYILPFSYSPDAVSCDVNTRLCKFPPCILIDDDPDFEEDADEDGYADDDPGKEVKKDERVIEHHQVEFNVYKELAKVIEMVMKEAKEITKDESNLVLRVIMQDRTPPRIVGCDNGNFPELGKDTPATTGDWYQIKGLRIIDNGSYLVGTCLCLGKIDKYPSIGWTEEEDWVKENPRKLLSGDEAEYVILPNMCHGVMRYSVFAWDEDGLLNPGEPQIEEDKPEICYGLRNPPSGYEDLLRDPDLAKPWPIKVSYVGDIDKVKMEDIKPGSRRGEGLVHIVDNDLPNILIKFESVKDRRKLVFPPAIEPGSLPVLSSGDYKKGMGIENANAKDYEDFVSGVSEVNFTSKLIENPNRIFFKILEVVPSKFMSPAEIAMLEKFKDPNEKEFIAKNFRLEDYNESDTDLAGNKILSDEATFGKRNGFGQEVAAVLEKPLQEDVEYVISIWADDNVKWATAEAGKVLDNIIPIPTGITSGEFTLEIPNQLPVYVKKGCFDPTSAVSQEIRAVFREPTVPGGGNSASFYENNRFPSISVSVTDFSGLTRKIKLFLRVSNENPNIRIIERQHDKKRQ
ncbi:MAG: hypothetical protein Kow0029_01310 [Candidatus Rifleibacteriota bacterium]